MSDLNTIGDVIQKEQARLWKHSPGLGLQSIWEQVAGPEIGSNTRVLSLRNGVMTVSCASGGWACELRLSAADLVDRLNGAGPPESIGELRFIHQAQEGWKSRK